MSSKKINLKKNVNQFLESARHEAPKIELNQRKSKFIEIYNKLPSSELATQAERCLECGVPYCQWKCPVHNYIPQWLRLAYEGRTIEAVELSHQTNSLPEICGRVCPQDRLCEGSCSLNGSLGAVTIGAVEKHITDSAFEQGWSFNYAPLLADAAKVAVIGSGPAGIACADVLRRKGYAVTVFERQSHIGGLLTYGIPGFKLEKSLIARRYEQLQKAGIEFRLNCAVGSDISLTEIESNYAAVFIGVGTYQAVTDAKVNNGGKNVILALDFLESINRQVIDNQPVTSEWEISGKKVVVLGGGDTTMDCIRSAIRLGASEVFGVSRGCEERLPGSRREFVNVAEEGGKFIFNAQVIDLVYAGDKLSKIRLIRTAENIDSKSKICSVERIAGSEFELECDILITAFGFRPETLPWLSDAQVVTASNGRINVAGESRQTQNSKIFAGGDIVRGASLVVHAIADGMQAAREIDNYLQQL
jgi:glutamate synthase (NADPH/NADH) small chain